MDSETDPWEELVRLTAPTAEQQALYLATNQLWDAITKLDMKLFDRLLEEFPNLKINCSCFFHAIEVSNVEAVQTFLTNGVDPNVSDESGRSPLWVASKIGYDSMIYILLDAGADPNQLPEDIDPETECSGESALFYAVLHGDEELVCHLRPITHPNVRVIAKQKLLTRLQLLD